MTGELEFVAKPQPMINPNSFDLATGQPQHKYLQPVGS
jgi:hypothetical protein